MTSGYLGHSIQTEVQLNQANFDVIKSVTGEAEADYFFAITSNDESLFARAKRNMIKNANLKGAQALVNVTTDVVITQSFFWREKKVIVSAEVVQFK